MNAQKMTYRAAGHDYSRAGIYHVTINVADGMGQPLGRVVGNTNAPDGSPDAPRTELSAVGRMVEQELLHSISHHYAMISIQDYVVMPDHLHFLMEVHDKILSSHGKTLPLGQVIAGFKKGCNKAFWAITGQDPAAPANSGAQTAANTAAASPSPDGASVPAGLPGGEAAPCEQAAARPYKVPSNGCTGRQPLFSPGFCDVMPVDATQLATQRQYIKDNPRYRLLRSSDRERLSTHRGTIDTALTPAALRGYLKRECPPYMATDEALDTIEARLLTANSNGGQTAANTNGAKGAIVCDSYGDRALLQRRLLPVVCHRCDREQLPRQKARCMEEAAQGAVLVSPRIAAGEQEIIDECLNHGFPVILIADNGFPPVYHPSTARTDLCSAGRLLLVSPWQYQYRGKNEQVSVPFCKTMNCIAQALARTKDNWWKTTN